MAEKNKTNLAFYNNNQYLPGKNGLVQALWFFINVVFFLNPLNPFSKLKVLLLRLFGAKVGKCVVIKPSVNIKYPWKLTIGNHVWIGEKVWIDNLADVYISDHCCVSQNALLLTGNHNYKKTGFDLMTGSIHLEEGVWIGARSVVSPNIRCFSHSVLAGGSFLSSNMEAYYIYRGNPAIKTKVRTIE